MKEKLKSFFVHYRIFVPVIILGMFVVGGFLSNFTEVSAVQCTGYTCEDVGTCVYTSTAPAPVCPTGQWVNCQTRSSTDAATGETVTTQYCECSVYCNYSGKYISGSACSNPWCSYAYSNTSCSLGSAPCGRVTTYTSGGSSGDGTTQETCPTGVFDITAAGGTSVSGYIDEAIPLSFSITSGPKKNDVAVITKIVNCPVGATCTSDSTYNVNTSNGATPGTMFITPRTTTPGTYSVDIKAYDSDNPECPKIITYSVTVKASRKVVCDATWREIPPGTIPDISSGPWILWNNGATNNEKYFKATYNGRYYTQYNQLTTAFGNFSTFCRYLNGMSDTCTWDYQVTMPNTGAYGYPAIYGWATNSGAIGATQSATDSSGRIMEVRRNGNAFEAKCTMPQSTTVAVCDGTWRYLHDRGATDYQPVGIYVGSTLDSQYKDAIVIAVGGQGATTNAYVQSCKFNGNSNCNFDSSWTGIGAVTSLPLNLSLGWSLNVALKTTWANGNWVYNINRSSGWSGWSDQGADNGILWGQPYRFVDKVGRTWQVRNASGGVAYACGDTPVCAVLNYNSSKSSISKTSLSAGEAFTVKCDYGVRGIDAVGVTTSGGASCAFSSWDSGNTTRTTANFNCTAGNTGGTFPVSCTNVAGSSSNICAQSNSLGNITVTAPVSAVADITASPLSVPYNTASTISWTSTNATSCSVDTGWTGTSGSRSSGNLTGDKTYTLTCLPSGINSVDSVRVSVQVPNQYGLTVLKSGQGRVTSSPSGIDCGGTCSKDFDQDTNVVLTATPASGRIFTGWTVQGGGSCPGTGTCTVTMSSAKTVTANFALNPNFIEF